MTNPKSTNIIWSESLIRKEQRQILLKQQGCIIWFTGLPSAGKSTIARTLESRLVSKGRFAYVLDGDNIRHNLNVDLGFSPEDRQENIRRIAEVAYLFADAGVIAITAFISPYRKLRDAARNAAKACPFAEIFVKTDLETCKKRDPKGLYKKALAGEISDFTGVSAPFEAPLNPELVIDTTDQSVDESVELVYQYMVNNGIFHHDDYDTGGGI